jgi:hypothetical protein
MSPIQRRCRLEHRHDRESVPPAFRSGLRHVPWTIFMPSSGAMPRTGVSTMRPCLGTRPSGALHLPADGRLTPRESASRSVADIGAHVSFLVPSNHHSTTFPACHGQEPEAYHSPG